MFLPVHVFTLRSDSFQLHLQLTAELERTLGREISQEISGGWGDLVPKVTGIAEEECSDNTTIQTLVSMAPASADMSDGKLADILRVSSHFNFHFLRCQKHPGGHLLVPSHE